MLRDHAVTQRRDSQRDWPTVLDSYGVQFLAVDVNSDGDLLQRFQEEPQWSVDFEDGDSVLFARTPTQQDAPFATKLPHSKGAAGK